MTLPSSRCRAFSDNAFTYLERLHKAFNKTNLEAVENLAEELRHAWIDGRNVFICGNGGSAANAIHIANDLHYGIGACGAGAKLPGLRIEALPANSGIITCLANDTGYENIYSHQLEVKSRRGDILIALSGSGNSPNIVKALITANQMGVKTFAILAFKGGHCKKIAKKWGAQSGLHCDTKYNVCRKCNKVNRLLFDRKLFQFTID